MTTASAWVTGSRLSIRPSPSERRCGANTGSGGRPLPCGLRDGAVLAELAAIDSADIVDGAELTEEAALGIFLEALFDQLPDHSHKDRIGPDRSNANHVHAELVGTVLSLDVEVEEHFQMVRDEPDRNYDHVFPAERMQVVQLVQNVGLEPRDLGWSTAALPGEPVTRNATEPCHEPADLTQLPFVGAAFSHRDRDAMRREDDFGGITAIPRQRLESRVDSLHHRVNESGVVVENADLVEPHLMLLEAHHAQGAHDVLAVLPAA